MYSWQLMFSDSGTACASSIASPSSGDPCFRILNLPTIRRYPTFVSSQAMVTAGKTSQRRQILVNYQNEAGEESCAQYTT